jgi:glucan phosphoethanolaminetransferase (alkaline phosphatase superfamily)
VNTYKNAMSFNAAFFDKVAMRVRDNPPPSFMIFLSDHGIINYDDGKNTYFGATKSNFHIPCFIYGNQAFRKQLPAEKAQALAEHRNMPISNTYIFDTIVSLAGIQYPEQREELDLTSPKATPALERKVWVWKQKLRYDDLP